MQNFFLMRMINWMATKLDGYKTLIGGLGLICTGIAGVIGKMFPDSGLPDQEMEYIMGQFSLGFVALGLGGKAEKIIKK